ncbi:hypothetical protein GOBAR_AA18939 [Gossypium barbadense]|uniref:Uncharacterized protein n=1 Tax=Gossypium barbadense TaxID=3634 RepID=A0A2P5XEG9_GOSBA|nr:hypothetical protein GOBAR_AA18939 [Gossypium barbadense]
MSEFSLASTTVVKKKTQFSSLLLSNFMLFCSLILSHPLYFSYFIFFSPYLFKIFSFLSPLFVTTSLLVIAFLTVLRSEVVDGESDDGFGCLEELEAYKIVFETSTIVDIRENPDEVSGVEPVVGCLQGVELEEASVQRVETLTSGEFTETVRVNATVKILEEFLRQKDDGVVEILSSKSVEANNDKGSNPKTTMNADNGEEFEAKAMVNSPIVKANYGDNDMNFGNLGSMRKEKEWKRTLACKLFEERHNAVVAAATTENEGGEGMDLLWETYENGKLCCLQALKFSTGKMNLGMGMGRPNFVKISKAFKGFGWLHHVGSTKHGKKGCWRLRERPQGEWIMGILRYLDNYSILETEFREILDRLNLMRETVECKFHLNHHPSFVLGFAALWSIQGMPNTSSFLSYSLP